MGRHRWHDRRRRRAAGLPRPAIRGHPPHHPAEWIIGSAAAAGPALAFVLLARKTQQPDRRAALLGIATGLGFGLASAYTKGMTEQLSAGGITAALASWELYAAVAAGITAGWLVQNAYHAGRLAASQPGITLADPTVSTAWGIVVFAEQVRGGPVLVLALVPLIALAGSVFLLSRSPVLQDTAGEAPGEAAEDTSSSRDTEKTARP